MLKIEELKRQFWHILMVLMILQLYPLVQRTNGRTAIKNNMLIDTVVILIIVLQGQFMVTARIWSYQPVSYHRSCPMTGQDRNRMQACRTPLMEYQ